MAQPVSELIRAWREAQGLTQEQAAKAIGCTQSAWNSWETKARRPQIHLAVRLAELTGGAVPLSVWGEPSPKEPIEAPPASNDPPKTAA